MRFLADEQCKTWFEGRGIILPDQTSPHVSERVQLDDWHPFAVAQWMADTLTCRDEVLLWITEWKIWPSGENWHLYYSLRQLAGDRGLLSEAPGHFFLAHEMEELKTVLQISFMNGWGGYFLAAGSDVNAFFSHDGYIDFNAASEERLATVRARFKTT